MARYPKGTTPKLTRELIQEISDTIRRGGYVEMATALCGISKDTFYRWLREGKNAKGNTLTRELSYAVERAMAEAEINDLNKISDAADGQCAQFLMDSNGNYILDKSGCVIMTRPPIKPDWRAAAWRLERRHPKRWGMRRTGEPSIFEELKNEQSCQLSSEQLKDEIHRLRMINDACDDT